MQDFVRRLIVQLSARATILLPLFPMGCGTTAGCKHSNDNPCPQITKGAIPEPNGTFVNGYTDLQTFKAQADEFTLYSNEFAHDGSKPGPLCEAHLHKIAHRWSEVPFPVLIQATPD